MTGPTHRLTSSLFSPRAVTLTRRRFAARAVGALATASLPKLRRAAAQATSDAADPPRAAIDGRETLRSLLALVPRRLIASGDMTSADKVSFTYVDFAGQFASLGLDQERLYRESFAEEVEYEDIVGSVSFLDVTGPLARPYDGFPLHLREELPPLLGFQPLLVGQILYVGPHGDQVVLCRGGIDLDTVPEAWEAVGYVRTGTADGTGIWTHERTGDDAPVRMGSWDNAAVLESGVVVFGHRPETLAETAALIGSGAASALDDADLAAAIDTLPDTTVSVIGMVPA
jgi:hypothetical protein